MSLINELTERLKLGFNRKTPQIYQSEAAECGLACLAMVAEYWGNKINFTLLRNEMSVSLNGSTLYDLVRMSQRLNLNGRPLHAGVDELRQIRLPCILHWNLNHFVVLTKVAGDRFYINDPAEGRRCIIKENFSVGFTGIVLELIPFDNMNVIIHSTPKLRFKDAFGSPIGLTTSLLKIVTLAFIFELCVLASSFLPQIIIDQVIPSQDINLLYLIVIGFGLLLILRIGVNFIRGWAVMAVSASFNLQWHAKIFHHLMSLPIPFFEKRNLGDIISRFDSMNAIESIITKQLVSLILDGLFAIGALIMMFMYNVQIAFIALLSMTVYLILRRFLFARFRQSNQEVIISKAKEKTFFLETVRSVQSIRLFGHITSRSIQWQNLLVDVRNSEIRQQKLGLGFEAMSTLIFGIEGLVIVLIGTAAALKGEMTIGMLITALSFKDQFSSRVSTFIDTLFTLKMMGLHMERIGDIVLSKSEIPETGATSSVDLTQINPSIEFCNVSFRYAENEPFILKDINFLISSGESVALVGPSGCGKTTIIKLILGILSPSSGKILVGGIPLPLLSVNNYRLLISTVMQDDALLAGSIEGNISFFASNVDFNNVRKAATNAAINNFIENLPMGYDTLIGELGNTLSGGQRQRILLARALYRKPKILILDEATSNLDQHCEEEINNVIRKQDLTRIIVAHRQSTISSVDRVIDLSLINNI